MEGLADETEAETTKDSPHLGEGVHLPIVSVTSSRIETPVGSGRKVWILILQKNRKDVRPAIVLLFLHCCTNSVIPGMRDSAIPRFFWQLQTFSNIASC